MPQDKNLELNKKKDSTESRNEANPGKAPVGTNTSEELNSENSPEVRDALNESQV